MTKYLLPLLLLLLALSPKNPAEVIRVIDGDTLQIWYYEAEMTVRLIGIDTPESKPNKKAYEDAKCTKENLWDIIRQGKMATEYVKNLVKPGDKIFLRLDKDETDMYNRILAYVYLKDGTFLNYKIIYDGYAVTMPIYPNYYFRWKFYWAHRGAMEDGRGLWK